MPRGASRQDSVLKSRALEDLKRSGLTEKDFKLMKLEVMSAEDTETFVGEPRASYKIPYFTADGKLSQYARVRFLEDRRGGFYKSKKGFRYSQPANSAPHIYFPPQADWRKIVKDTEIPITITEGEKKAAAACKAGIACIALGGVYGYRSSKRLQDLIPEFQSIDWEGRVVEICYDSDVMHKSEVRQALTGLAFAITQECNPREVRFVFLDAEVAGENTALDDYLIEHGAEKYHELPRQEYRINAKIQQLNSRLCFVESVGRFYDIKAGLYYRSLFHLREAYMHAGEELVNGKTPTLVIDLWAKSPHRRTVNKIVYMPGEGSTVNENDLNIWVPPQVAPIKAVPKLWLELVEYIFRTPQYADWFIKWLAYPLQHPRTKMLTSVFVYGERQGVGKTFVVDPVMEMIYGEENFYRLSNEELQSAFNSYAQKTQFVVTNEIYTSDVRDRRSVMSKLKDMITRERVTVNEKFIPKQVCPDYCNYMFTSNHSDALMLEKGDRRFFVIEAPSEPLPASTYQELDEWLRTNDGAGQILHYLLHRVDLSGFDPKAPAPDTDWKHQVIGLGRDVLYEFAERIVEEPEMYLMHNGRTPQLKLYRAEDLVRVFESAYPRYRQQITANRMARLLSDERLERRTVRESATSPLVTLYAVFDRDVWRTKKNKDWASHYMITHRRYGGAGEWSH